MKTLPLLCSIFYLLSIVPTFAANTNLVLPPRLTLSGTVVDATSTLVSGATVLIYSAKPREGSSSLCPTCYADCSKSSQTDESGSFTISQLDPTLSFRLLTVADGFHPQHTLEVRPELGQATIQLRARNDQAIPRNQKTRGRITNHHGEAIVGAAVSVEGVQTENSVRWSASQDVDPLALSDANGIFTITSKIPFVAVNVRIEARNYAPLNYNGLKSGKNWTIQLVEGASVEGRIRRDGKPMAGLTVLLTGQDRKSGNFVGHFEIATDDEGHFQFLNTPGETDYYLSGKILDFEPYGALSTRTVRTPKEGKIDVGNLEIESSLTIDGQLLLTDNEPIPDQTRILLSPGRGWDSVEAIVKADGTFHFSGLNRETYDLMLRIPNHRFALENPNLTAYSSTHLQGFLGRNLANLIILVEKGDHHDRATLEKNRNQYSHSGQLRSSKPIPPRFLTSPTR